MKPAPFAYHAPTSAEEAVAMLAEFGDRGRVLASGQSLFQLMDSGPPSPRTSSPSIR